MKAEFIDVNGLRTRYLSGGAGKPLVLVQPVGYPAEVFTRTITGLEDRFQLIAPDVPGQGFSEAPTRWTQPPQIVMADHVTALADALGLGRFSVLGSSLGGLVAALVALRCPERVESLILVGTGSVFNDPAGQPKVLQAVRANGSRAYTDPSLATLRDRLAKTCYLLPPADDVLLATMTAYALPGAADAYHSIIDGLSASMGDPDATVYGRLEKILMRTLVVVGANDVRTSYEAHCAGARRMRDARVQRLENCGHLPYLELPHEFNAALSAFLL
jgi:2-hydroxy-6-oxonona-2,4-dienedioate hydrolase